MFNLNIIYSGLIWTKMEFMWQLCVYIPYTNIQENHSVDLLLKFTSRNIVNSFHAVSAKNAYRQTPWIVIFCVYIVL